MTITWLAPYAADVTTSATSNTYYPADSQAGDKIFLVVGQKPATANGGGITTPAGFNLLTSITGAGGYGTTTGTDVGNTNLFVYERTVPTGGLSGTLSLVGTDQSVRWSVMLHVRGTVGGWSVAAATGSDTSSGNVSISFGSDPGVTANDLVIGVMCIPTDVTTPSQFSAEAFTQAGVTFGTVVEVSEPDTSLGNDIGGFICYAPVASGTSTGTPTMTATAGGTTTDVRGPGVFIRVREAEASAVAYQPRTWDSTAWGLRGWSETRWQ